LDKAEALRTKRRAALAELDSLSQSLFLDLFGDPATNPKGWAMSSLAEVCSIAGQYGSGVPAVEFSQSLPRYVRITDIDSEGNLAPGRVSPGGTSADWSDLKLESGDVLFARSGATVGKTYMYSPGDGDCVFAGYLIRFRTLPTKVLPEVLFHFTRSTAYLCWVIARQRVVAQPNINAKQYGTELNIPLPPLDLQREFARRVAAVEKLKSAQRSSLADLDTLFFSLQQRAFSGNL
jgi:type I restriction enzyme S subunit